MVDCKDFFKARPPAPPPEPEKKLEPVKQKKPKGYPKGLPHKMTFRNPDLNRSAYTKYNRWKGVTNEHTAGHNNPGSK